MSELKITKKRAIKKRAPGNTELANKPTMLLVLGMHRSGTSVTARLMECLGGVNSSNQLPAAVDNPNGFFEDSDIYQLNESTVLPRLDIKWHSVGFVDWSRLSSPDRSKLALQALEIVRKNYNPANSLSIIKEPRIGILLPFWLSVLRHAGYNVKVVCAVRDPISVARSLHKRNGLSTTHGGMLYVTNWLSILNYIQELPVAFVSFEEVFQDPAAVLRKVADKLQIRPPQDFEVRVHHFASDFIDPALCHNRIESQDLALETDLPPLAIEVYEHLLAAAQFQNIKKTGRFVPNSEKRIASIKPVLEDFDRLLHRLHQESSRNAELQRSYEATKSIADQSTASIQASQEQARQLIQKEALQRGEIAERLSRLNTEKASLEAALAEAHAQRQALSTELEHEKTRTAEAASQIAENNAACASLHDQVAAAQTQAAQLQQRIHELETANNRLAAERGELVERHTGLNTEKASLEAALAEARAQRQALSTELEHEKTRAAEAANLSAKTNAACASLQDQVAAAQTQATQLQQRIHELETANNQLTYDRGEMAELHSELNAEKARLKAALAEAHAERQALSTELEHEKSRSHSANAQIAEAATVFANLRNQIETANSEIDQHKKNQQQLKSDNNQLVLERNELIEHLSKNEGQLQKAQAQLNEREISTKELENEILQENERNAELETKSASSEARCKTLEEECNELRANIAERFEELAKITQMFLQAEAERDAKHKEIEETCARYANQRGMLAEKITEIQSSLSNACAQRDELSNKSQQLEIRCGNLQNNINERFHELAKCAQLIVTKDGELEDLQNQIAKLRNSMSWKMTKIMRWPIFMRYTRSQRFLRKNIKIIKKSGLFDAEYYLHTYPDVSLSKIDPVYHYLNHGAKEGRNPSKLFNTTGYLNFYNDVRDDKNSINPLLHFIIYGKKEGRICKFNKHSESSSAIRIYDKLNDNLYYNKNIQSFGHFPHDPLVSVIIVSYNSSHDLKVLLPTIKNQSYTNIELIVVENGTEDNEYAVKSIFEKALYLHGHGNVGFAAANNLAFNEATGELIALINPDTKVDTDWLRHLVESLKIDADAAAAVPKIRFFERYTDIIIKSEGEFNIDPTALASQLNYAKWFIISGAEHAKDFVAGSKDESVIIRVPIDGSYVRLPLHCQYAQEVQIYNRNTEIPIFVLSASEKGDYEINIDLTNEANPHSQWLINNAGSGIGEEGPYDIGICNYDDGMYNSKAYVQALCGCSALLRRVAIVGRNIFAPEFYAYYEDSELSSWIHKQGYKILYTPLSIVYHKHSTSSSEGSQLWNTLVSRGRDFYIATNQPDQLEIIQSIKNRKYSSAIPEKLANKLSEYDRDFIENINNIASRNKTTVGIYNSYWNTMGGGELHALSFAVKLQQNCDVYLICEEDFDINRMASYFNLNLSRCRKIVLPHFSSAWTQKFDVFINSTFLSNISSSAKLSLYIVSFPQNKLDKKIRDNYIFLHNSNYTKYWATKFWGDHKSYVILPILSAVTPCTSRSLKEKMILSVGRFTPNGHCKNHDLIIKSFLQAISKSKNLNSWKLVLCGSYNESKEEEYKYIKNLQFLAKGAPVEIIPNIEYHALSELYDKASIYVHATGMGRDEILEPHLHEHFGISCFEAMSYGCYPIVYHVGGPSEQIRSMNIGSCFRNTKELAKQINNYAALWDEEKSKIYATHIRMKSRQVIKVNDNSLEIINDLISTIKE